MLGEQGKWISECSFAYTSVSEFSAFHRVHSGEFRKLQDIFISHTDGAKTKLILEDPAPSRRNVASIDS